MKASWKKSKVAEGVGKVYEENDDDSGSGGGSGTQSHCDRMSLTN